MEQCIDIMLYWSNELYQNNGQPNYGKELIAFWNTLCDAMAESFCQLGEIQGKFLLPIVCTKAMEAKQTADMASELCEKIEHIYPPAICYKVYLTTIEKTKSNAVKANCMTRLAKACWDYGMP